MKTTFTTNMFGRDYEVEYSKNALAYAIVVLRVVIGWIFLQAGLTKLFAGSWSAAGFLNNAIPEGNPFMGLWSGLAGSPLVDALNIYGAIAIGITLILGLTVRFSALCGAILMILYWMAGLQGGLLAGFPVEHGWFIDSHIVYAVLLFGLGALGAGRILGLDAILEQTEFVEQTPALKYLLG